MTNSNIFILAGTEKEILTNLIKKGTPSTLIIRTKYVPKDGEKTLDPQIEADMSEYKLENSMIRALVNKNYELYLIDREEVTDEDLKFYSYIARNQSCKLRSVSIVSETPPHNREKPKGIIIFTKGTTSRGFIDTVIKGASNPVELSKNTLSASSEMRDETRVRDIIFLKALNEEADLIVVTDEVLGEKHKDYSQIFERFALTFNYKLLKVSVAADPAEIAKAVSRQTSSPTTEESTSNGVDVIVEKSKSLWKSFKEKVHGVAAKGKPLFTPPPQENPPPEES